MYFDETLFYGNEWLHMSKTCIVPDCESLGGRRCEVMLGGNSILISCSRTNDDLLGGILGGNSICMHTHE